MSNPNLGDISQPETKSNVVAGSVNEGEPVYSNIQGGTKRVEHVDLKENPAAPTQPHKCLTDISLIKPTSDVVTIPGRTQLLQNVDNLGLPRSRCISNSIDEGGMESTSMNNFRFIINQLLQARRKPAEFNERVPKPKGPRAPPAAWGKPAN